MTFSVKAKSEGPLATIVAFQTVWVPPAAGGVAVSVIGDEQGQLDSPAPFAFVPFDCDFGCLLRVGAMTVGGEQGGCAIRGGEIRGGSTRGAWVRASP